ncbi:hypothetical protein [Limnospira platensis]|uniref:hypothetical protein n=1 Tax=Limnospira platensis TaxID=118562 RepID=UPI0001C394F8|nr:hypothetical protein AP285_12960 [Arthrospira platensis YZ]MDF2210400.1 hypothetical protein [Arthrospira platensis NCB002]QQW31520.1 hypothetical protein AP9108_14065 [Arthrospira sp. PCC 9108]
MSKFETSGADAQIENKAFQETKIKTGFEWVDRARLDGQSLGDRSIFKHQWERIKIIIDYYSCFHPPSLGLRCIVHFLYKFGFNCEITEL